MNKQEIIDTLLNIIKVSKHSSSGIKEIDITDEEAIYEAIKHIERSSKYRKKYKRYKNKYLTLNRRWLILLDDNSDKVVFDPQEELSEDFKAIQEYFNPEYKNPLLKEVEKELSKAGYNIISNNQLPKSKGDYLICRNILGNNNISLVYDVLSYSKDLYSVDEYDFPPIKYKNKAGFYDYGDGGYYEVKDILAWMPIPGIKYI